MGSPDSQKCDDRCYEHEYSLQGPQVEPSAGYWNYCAKLRIVSIDELRAFTDDHTHNPDHYFPPYPKDQPTIDREIKELIDLAKHRDDPCHLVSQDGCKGEVEDEKKNICAAEKKRDPERPIEYARRNNIKELTVLFDCPDELNPAYTLCPDARPGCRAAVQGDLPPANAPVSPGTPRHPAYPSGHSTYSAAASAILEYFFGDEDVPPFLVPHPRLGSMPDTDMRTEIRLLAENIGLGRMWAGVHWRSDHEEGRRLGRSVACLVLRQLADMGSIDGKKVVPFNLCPKELQMPEDQCTGKVKDCPTNQDPPKRSELCAQADKIADKCPKEKPLGDPCPPPPQPDKAKHPDHWSMRIDANRGPQQGGE